MNRANVISKMSNNSKSKKMLIFPLPNSSDDQKPPEAPIREKNHPKVKGEPTPWEANPKRK